MQMKFPFKPKLQEYSSSTFKVTYTLFKVLTAIPAILQFEYVKSAQI